jgi:uncharacterized protein (DUF1501 family)
MLAIPGGSSPSCDGVSRRSFLRVGSLAALGTSLPGLLRAESRWANPRPDVSCILVWLQGGISHIDTFDPKPDAPSEFRGDFAAIPTRVPGISICEHLPKLAAQQDKYSIVRSLDPRNGSHGMADAYVLSGHPFNPTLTFPSYGSIVSHQKGDREGMPPYVQIGRHIDARFGGGAAGFLGEQHNPFVLPADPASADFAHRIKALHAVDTDQKSYGLVTSPPNQTAFDLEKESPKIRDRYGRNSLGQGCLLARRLIDSGARFVTVTDAGWDTHRDNFTTLKDRLLPRLDSAISGLLQDLHDRGRLDSTMVIVLSDFGRTPKVNPLAGRDHWSSSSFALLAGGGLRGGVAVGRTNLLAEVPVEASYATEDLAATVYHGLGIPLSTTHKTPDGRPIQINYDGRLIRELL